ncbi:MAG: alpha/beta hydrolase [Acidobacteria bacterium]|nr:alpha/beta hydrolase [Acidobacteriota bacterium]
MRVATLVLSCVLTTSCSLYYWTGIRLYYRKAEIPDARAVRDLAYAGPASTPKQRLNLFLPAGKDWPIVLFVHGGNWDDGDRNLEVGGADVYNNIGRFLASNGVGAAVMSYRLLPSVDWRTQITDITAAGRWLAENVRRHGGSSACVFLMGHSAGAQLAVRTALDRAARMPRVCGVIAVSGAGYDLTDRRTWDLGADEAWYARRFGGAAGWQQAASPIQFVSRNAPPFLILYAGGESKPLQRQSQLLHETLVQAGAPSEIVVVPGESHSRIVLTLSRPDKTAGPAILRFVRAHVSQGGQPPFSKDR